MPGVWPGSPNIRSRLRFLMPHRLARRTEATTSACVWMRPRVRSNALWDACMPMESRFTPPPMAVRSQSSVRVPGLASVVNSMPAGKA